MKPDHAAHPQRCVGSRFYAQPDGWTAPAHDNFMRQMRIIFLGWSAGAAHA
jgi:hypothetical protein